MKVKDAMHRGTMCAEATTSVRRLAKQMRDKDIGGEVLRAVSAHHP